MFIHYIHRKTTTTFTEERAQIIQKNVQTLKQIEPKPWHRWHELPVVADTQATGGWSSFTNNENHT